MSDSNKINWNHDRIKRLTDVRNIGLYVFSLVVLAITWSGVKTVQNNYDLQKKISTIKQQNSVQQLENQNAELQNRFLATDQYLDIAARQNLGLAAPGEKVLLVPKAVAMKYVDRSLISAAKKQVNNGAADTRSRYIKNLEAWRDFLLGHKANN